MFCIGCARNLLRTLKWSAVSEKQWLDQRSLLGHIGPATISTTTFRTFTTSNPCSNCETNQWLYHVQRFYISKLINGIGKKLTELVVLERKYPCPFFTRNVISKGVSYQCNISIGVVVLERNKLTVSVISESMLSSKSKNLCIRNYTTVCKDRSHGQDGAYSSLFTDRLPSPNSHFYQSRYLIPT